MTLGKPNTLYKKNYSNKTNVYDTRSCSPKYEKSTEAQL
jgi:hypothetical protein